MNSPNGPVPIRSTWKDPIGKPLTNRRIAFYQREGRYGREAQERALASCVDVNGFVNRCCEPGCNTYINVRWCTFLYLPKVGYYCPKCRQKHRNEALKEKELNKRIIAEYE